MTNSDMFEKSFSRPSYYFDMSFERQWEVDKDLGILDWSVADLSIEDYTRFVNHYNFSPSRKTKMIESYKKKRG